MTFVRNEIAVNKETNEIFFFKPEKHDSIAEKLRHPTTEEKNIILNMLKSAIDGGKPDIYNIVIKLKG